MGRQVFAKTFTAGDGATVLTASFTLPLVQNTDACPAGTAINDWYKQEGSSRMLEAEEQYEMAVADYDVSQAAGFPFSPTTQEMTYTVAYEDENLISIRRELYVAAEGAAHPSAFLLAETFDAATGEKLGFSRVFTDADTVRERWWTPSCPSTAWRTAGTRSPWPGSGAVLPVGGGLCVLAGRRRAARGEQPH